MEPRHDRKGPGAALAAVYANGLAIRESLHGPGREAAETYGLAAIGAVQGIYKYYVRPEITARRTWAGIAGLVVAHEFICPPGELLSEGADRLIDNHPIAQAAILAAGMIITAHVANALPERWDPFKRGLDLLRQ